MKIEAWPMKRYAAIVISLLSVVGLVTGVVAGMRRAHGMEVRLNKRDLPRHGIHIITSADPLFEVTAANYFKDKSNKSFESLKPFSVFIKNSGNKSVVAYALMWQIVKPDGRILTNTNSYSEPGVLMGDLIPADPRFKHTQTLEPDAVKCLSWSGPINAETQDRLGGGGVSQSKQGQTFQETDSDMTRSELSTELSEATDMTVSIDGVFFDDGTFIGPNVTGFFERIQAIVNAKVDLLHDVALASERGEVDRALESISEKSLAEDVTITTTSTPDDYYKYYGKLFAIEISGMKAAYGKERLVAHLVNSHNRARPLLRK